MTYWYVGSPYSKYHLGLEAAALMVAKETARVIEAGIPAFSPIAHGHVLAVVGGLDPLDYKIWLPLNRPFMDGACGLIVLMMHGWEESVGLTAEIQAFREALKPVLYMNLGESIRQVFAYLNPRPIAKL